MRRDPHRLRVSGAANGLMTGPRRPSIALTVVAVAALTFGLTMTASGALPGGVAHAQVSIGAPIPAAVSVIAAHAESVDTPSSTAVAGQLRKPLASSALGTRVGVLVVDVESGATVFAQNAGASFMPASVTKLITAAVAVEILGADARYRVERTGTRKKLTADAAGSSVASLVEFMLKYSDNALSQGLADESVRLSGRAWNPLAKRVLAARGIDTSSLTLYDGSGLSRRNQMSPVVPTSLTVLVTRGGKTDPWWPVLSGLPVAGWDGTLLSRFTTSAAAPGRGVVRGKTGTLTGVTTLSGLMTTSSGDLLAYAFMADRVPGTYSGRLASRKVWDQVGSVLAQCGCRK
jgi:D-alanyl-D-alanine carboxypeptidase